MNKMDYTRFQNRTIEERFSQTPVQETVEEPVVAELETKKLVVGEISGCKKLNVRKHPNPNSEVVCELPVGSKVEIDEESSTGEFYKVCNSAGVEGYCMKSYISIC